MTMSSIPGESEDSYPNGRAIRQAIKAAALASGPRDTVAERIQMAWFDRFLCRVFRSDSRSEWLLKGGFGLLSRLTDTRSTSDIDFTVSGKNLDDAVAELQAMASLNLGDHLKFEMYKPPIDIVERSDHVHGRRLFFLGRVDKQEVTRFHVDIVIAAPPVGNVSVLDPQHRLELKRPLPTAQYRIFPLEDQLAEKIVGALVHVNGVENSRLKDFLDILTITRTYVIDQATLQQALSVTLLSLRTVLPDKVDLPKSWQARYARESKTTILRNTTFNEAVEEANKVLKTLLHSKLAENSTHTPRKYLRSVSGSSGQGNSPTQYPGA